MSNKTKRKSVVTQQESEKKKKFARREQALREHIEAAHDAMRNIKDAAVGDFSAFQVAFIELAPYVAASVSEAGRLLAQLSALAAEQQAKTFTESILADAEVNDGVGR